jgi:hypothetical protein
MNRQLTSELNVFQSDCVVLAWMKFASQLKKMFAFFLVGRGRPCDEWVLHETVPTRPAAMSKWPFVIAQCLSFSADRWHSAANVPTASDRASTSIGSKLLQAKICRG